MRRSLKSVGTIAMLLIALVLWALSGTIGLDGQAPPPAPPALSEAPGEFTLVVEPSETRVDRPISVRLENLDGGEQVVLRTSTADAAGTRFTSWARFMADENGVLDLSARAPVTGTYEGIDPSGLLWSMRSEDEALFRTDPRWDARRVELRAETAGGTRQIELVRRYPWTMTVREEVRLPGLVADLTFMPTIDEPYPVILLLGGWGDGPSPLTAALLADEGYAVVNLGYYLWPGTPPRLVEIPLETVMRAIDWIEQDERLDGGRIGVYGTSKGAELALLAASHEPRVRAVAAWAPSSVAFSGIDFGDPTPGSSWTFEGRPVAYAEPRLGPAEIRNSLRFLLGRPMIFRPSYEKALATAPAEAFIPVERIQGPVLLLSGTDDQLWPSDVMAGQISSRMARHGHERNVVSLTFDGAGHGINFALWPRGGRRTGRIYRGGTESLDHRAGQAAWRAMLDLFESSLGEAPRPPGKRSLPAPPTPASNPSSAAASGSPSR